jgi:hypothetical protein
VFEHCDRLFALHSGKIIEELVEGMTPFEIFEERLDRDARTDEDRRAAQHVRPRLDDGAGRKGHGLRILPDSTRCARKLGAPRVRSRSDSVAFVRERDALER